MEKRGLEGRHRGDRAGLNGVILHTKIRVFIMTTLFIGREILYSTSTFQQIYRTNGRCTITTPTSNKHNTVVVMSTRTSKSTPKGTLQVALVWSTAVVLLLSPMAVAWTVDNSNYNSRSPPAIPVQTRIYCRRRSEINDSSRAVLPSGNTCTQQTFGGLSLFNHNNRKRRHHHHQQQQQRRDGEIATTSFHALLQKTLIGAILSGFLVFLPPPAIISHSFPDAFPYAVHASDDHTSTVVTTKTAPAISSPTITAPTITSSATKQQRQQPTAEQVVEETWNLVNKYYMDPTYNNQDWNQVREKYVALARKQSSNNDDTAVSIKLITEMVSSLGDKYSRVLDPTAYAAIQKYDLIGVGVTLMPNEAKEIIVGAPPIAGSAADKANLEMGDKVTAINGLPTKGRTAFDIIDQISENPSAETVTMSVIKKDALPDTPAIDYVMARQFQQVTNPIRYKISERRDDGTVVGFIKILEFNSLVKPKLEDALRELKTAGANAFVLDLRQNTGGAFQSAVEISSLFLNHRVATYVVDNTDKELPFRTASNQVMVDPAAPVVMWLDGRSASASEVLAGSLHDNCRAVIMGEKSFGKGLIQAVYGLKNGAGLVLTVAKYVTPSGNSIQGVGITPDLPGGVPLPIPGIYTDTSKIDFGAIKNRLDPAVCPVPDG